MKNKVKTKIYEDGEWATGKEECINCKTKESVFYDKRSDFFMCSKCLREHEEKC
ncbi:hypothetical protein [Clostridium sp.]|uniref:hypothetical protein n=1 Tax=Clostridium sp. TaxID=1506 RepID=UPI001A3D94B2|nr:hypothetical protein [Clostridium sp.]MBK5243194.1 hypothetical protein [Clostridium sp.]